MQPTAGASIVLKIRISTVLIRATFLKPPIWSFVSTCWVTPHHVQFRTASDSRNVLVVVPRRRTERNVVLDTADAAESTLHFYFLPLYFNLHFLSPRECRL